MTDHPITKAFGEGLRDEQRLIDEGKYQNWSEIEWWERKLHLDEEIELARDETRKAHLNGRLLALSVQARIHFGSAKVLDR
jgi:hypothetical protein